MRNFDLPRRAEIGRVRRAQTRSQILEAGAKLFSERPTGATTVDSVVLAACVAKGTFYYHFQSMDDLVAAVGEKLAESFNEVLAPDMFAVSDPIARLSVGLAKFLDKAIADPTWARLVVQSSHLSVVFGRRMRAHLQVDVAQAIADGRVSMQDEHLATDIVIGIWLGIARGTLERRPAADLTAKALAALLRALGASQ